MAEEHSFWSDKVVKRGLGGKDNSPPKVGPSSPEQLRNHPTFPSLPSTYEPKLPQISHTRVVRGLENCIPKGYILVIISLISIFALSGSFMFAHSFGQPPMTEEGFGLSFISSKLRITDSLRVSEDSPTKNDPLPSRTKSLEDVSCDPVYAKLKVYMYDLPLEFHFGMMGLEPDPGNPSQVWPRNLSQLPRYPGGLYQQHSPEYWLTADLLTSTLPNRRSECTAVRVSNAEEAHVFFVPFFASLSYNKYTKLEHRANDDKNEDLQEKLVKYLKEQKWWQMSDGKDHVVVIHHPNSMHLVREQLSAAMFIVADFGRYSSEVANIGKDIVAPYKHVIPAFRNDLTTFESRTLLLFFQGAIVRKEGGIIRQQLNELLKDQEGVYFATGNTQRDGIKSATHGMRSSKFCLHLAGDTPSSNRLFDAIASHCVPVIISDDIELPYEDDVDYSAFCLFVRSTDALQKGFVISLLRSIKKAEWTRMWQRLTEVDHHFEYQHPTKPDDAVNMVWKAIARKVPSVKFKLNKKKRCRAAWNKQPASSDVTISCSKLLKKRKVPVAQWAIVCSNLLLRKIRRGMPFYKFATAKLTVAPPRVNCSVKDACCLSVGHYW